MVGPPGSQKSSLLSDIAARLASRGRPVEGFLSIAGNRPDADSGADSYALLMLPEGAEVPFAERDAAFSPPYRFLPEALQTVSDWADGLADRRPERIILDEFGPFELRGEGHFPIWKRVVDAEPAVVLMAVRPSVVEAMEAKLGRAFDLQVSPDEENVRDRLEALCTEPRDWEAVGLYGGASGAVEMTLGSALHGAQVPLRGQVLSTIQSLMLTAAAEGLVVRARVSWVAIVSAGLKALSPAGNRLRPMVAIASQGVLFSVSIQLFGWNPFAVGIGGFLVGAWSAVQGVVFQWLLVGGPMIQAYDTGVKWVTHSLRLGEVGLPVVLGTIVVLSGILTGGATATFWGRRHQGMRKLIDQAEKHRPVIQTTSDWRSAVKGAFRDLARPSFWVPILIIVAILRLTKTSWNEEFWVVIRAVSVGLLLFGAARMISPVRFAKWLRTRGLYGPAVALERGFRRSFK